MQKTKIITTVGTSVFENYLKDKTVSEHQKKDFRTDYNNLKEEALPFNKWESCKDELDELEESITSWYHNKPNASAETKSILKIAEQTKNEVEVHLIATDTVLSVKAAELVKGWLSANNKPVSEKIKVIDGLSVEDADAFVNSGIQNLIEEVLNIHEADKNNNSILNISGGFKAMIPVLTIVGQLYDIPLFYIYENSETPIELQRLPINFDWEIMEAFSVYLANPSRLKKIDGSDVAESMLNLQIVRKVADDYQLTFLGQLMKNLLKRRPPLFDTVFGYFVEHKLKECLERELSQEKKVIHALKSQTKPLSFTGDIDLVVIDNGKMETVEVKPLYRLNDETYILDTISKLLKRAKGAETEMKEKVDTLCLMLYDFTLDKKPKNYQISSEQLNTAETLKKMIEEFNPNVNFKIQFFYVTANKIESGRRMLYQSFLERSLKYEQIQTIFPIQ